MGLKEETERKKKWTENILINTSSTTHGNGLGPSTSTTTLASRRKTRQTLRRTQAYAHGGGGGGEYEEDEKMSQFEMQTRKWLHKQLHQLVEQEETKENLRRQCEQQLTFLQ